MSGCNFSEPIPTWLGNLKTLPVVPSSVNSFLMERDRFSGEIPYTACNATFLTILDISRNNLRGTIPSCLGNISNFLSVMNLQGNHLHGTHLQKVTG
ncbi:receptor-like protein 42 [Quercus suber]|uniref:Receptor-like protein 42 n=1 Tax=Quercus suber TaxID=58331 RepID=A0AAW0JMZ7_QUESU